MIPLYDRVLLKKSFAPSSLTHFLLSKTNKSAYSIESCLNFYNSFSQRTRLHMSHIRFQYRMSPSVLPGSSLRSRENFHDQSYSSTFANARSNCNTGCYFCSRSFYFLQWKTAHSVFKIPIPCFNYSVCNISMDSEPAKEI